MRELAKLLLLSGLQNQDSPQCVLALPQSNPVIIIPTEGAFPSPNLLTETTEVWDKGSGFNRTSAHLPTPPSLPAVFTLHLILLKRDVPCPLLKGSCVESLWCCHNHFILAWWAVPTSVLLDHPIWHDGKATDLSY